MISFSSPRRVSRRAFSSALVTRPSRRSSIERASSFGARRVLDSARARATRARRAASSRRVRHLGLPPLEARQLRLGARRSPPAPSRSLCRCSLDARIGGAVRRCAARRASPLRSAMRARPAPPPRASSAATSLRHEVALARRAARRGLDISLCSTSACCSRCGAAPPAGPCARSIAASSARTSFSAREARVLRRLERSPRPRAPRAATTSSSASRAASAVRRLALALRQRARPPRLRA